MNLLDLILLGLLAFSALGGWRYGLIARLASWIGLLLGLGASIWTVPTVLRWFDGGTPTGRFLIGVAILSLTVSIVAGVFQRLGSGMRRFIHGTPLRVVDRAAGLVAGVALLGVVVWLLVPAAAYVPGQFASQVRGSALVGAVERTAPAPPDAISALGSLVDLQRFPDVFDDLRPAPDTGPPPSQIPVSADVVDAATASTVRIDARGCSRNYVGSGWAVAEDQIVTNAHVIAGADDLEVRRPDGEVLPARVIRFDAEKDLAVLQVDGLGQSPLAIGEVVPDSDAAVIGYPGGQNEPRVAPATVREERRTTGRDIYRESPAERQVVYLAATLRQGDSGSPVINDEGAVVGVVFAISPDRNTTAYSLAPSEVEALLAGPETSSTDRCM